MRRALKRVRDDLRASEAKIEEAAAAAGAVEGELQEYKVGGENTLSQILSLSYFFFTLGRA